MLSLQKTLFFNLWSPDLVQPLKLCFSRCLKSPLIVLESRSWPNHTYEMSCCLELIYLSRAVGSVPLAAVGWKINSSYISSAVDCAVRKGMRVRNSLFSPVKSSDELTATNVACLWALRAQESNFHAAQIECWCFSDSWINSNYKLQSHLHFLHEMR